VHGASRPEFSAGFDVKCTPPTADRAVAQLPGRPVPNLGGTESTNATLSAIGGSKAVIERAPTLKGSAVMRAHRHRAAFERDRKRDQVMVSAGDQVMVSAGYRFLRVTWRQLRDEPLFVVARLAQALNLTGPLG
jgi:hypothetical protein